MSDVRRPGIRATTVRIVGLLFAATALAAVALWYAAGATVPPSLDDEDQQAARTDTLYISIVTIGKQPDADRISARLLAEGYRTVDSKQGTFDWYGHNLVIDRPFTQQESRAAAAKLSREFPGTLIQIGSLHHAVLTGDMRRGRLPFSYVVYGGFLVSMGSVARVAMSAATLEITVAGALAFWLLLLRRQSWEVLRLGLALSCFSLYTFYLTLYSAAPLFSTYQPRPWALRIIVDVAAVELVVVGFYAFTKFWEAFPQAVPKGELEAFLQARRATQLGRLGSALPAGPVQTVGESARFIVMLTLGLLAGLVWTGGFLLPGDWPAVVIQVVFGTFLVVVVYWPGLTCLRLFSYHRSNGSADDRRKIEWVWASLWMAFVVLAAPLTALAFLKVGSAFLPELDDWTDIALAVEIVALNVAPTLVFVTIALSIQYRGSVDPRLALRGFTVWTLLSVVLTLVFVFVERTIALRLVGWWHLPPQTGFVTAGAIVAATFQPIRRQVEKYVNRFVERVLPTTLVASGVRHVRAVAIVDISAHTSESAADDQVALLASALVQKEARRLTDRHGGRVVNTTGDRVILCFEDPRQALDVVRELHAGIRNGAAALNIPKLILHSGLNLGEVVEMHDGNIYGVAVNITARIADWARVGEIGVSEAFRNALAEAPAGLVACGPQLFKNVPQPISCFRLADA